MLGIFHVFVVICWLFSKLTLKKVLSGTLSECQTAWIQIRANILSVLIWVETVCKGYQQTAKVASSKERVNSIKLLITQNGNCGSHGIYKHFNSQLKKQMKMLSAAIFFHQKKIHFNFNAKSVDIKQTAPYGAVCSMFTLFAREASKIQKQTPKLQMGKGLLVFQFYWRCAAALRLIAYKAHRTHPVLCTH